MGEGEQPQGQGRPAVPPPPSWGRAAPPPEEPPGAAREAERVRPAPPRPRTRETFERPRSTPLPPGSQRVIRLGTSSGVAVAAVAALLVGGVAYLARDDGGPARSGDRPAARGDAPAARPADGPFAVPPALYSGHRQAITGVAVRGGTTVTIGSETAGRTRGQFLVSTDGGKQWRAATAGGGVPHALAAGPRGWAALGGGDAGVVAWTSGDGRSWTSHAGERAAFQDGDRVAALAATGGGFVAAGTDGKGAPTVWTSADGGTWQRVTPTGTKGRPTRLAAGTGDVLVMQSDAGLWRSTDGGRVWTPVEIPQSDGSRGGVVALVSGPGGFHAAREGRGGGKKNRKRAVFFRSADGVGWARSGVIDRRGYVRLAAFGGSEAGLAAVVPLEDGRLAVHRSPDGARWQPVERLDAPGGRRAETTAALPKGVLVAGRQDNGAYLTVPGAKDGDVDLLAVPGAVMPDRALARLVSGGGTALVVGGANGDAAVWSTRDGDTWTRAGGTGMTGPDVQSLAAAAHGPHGWAAAGRTRDVPLLLTSADGTAWKPAYLGGSGELSGVAHGPAGYAAVGWSGGSAVAWHSRDLNRWERGNGDLKDARMRDVAATGGGYVAVGGGKDGRARAWTSADGRRWTAVAVPPEAGALTRVAARGDTLTALGETAVAVSSDAGRTWRVRPLRADALTALTATARGFVAAGQIGDDVALWTSADGEAWKREQPRGDRLSGEGDQRLTGLGVLGDDLLAVGQDGDVPVLWRRPTP